MLNIKKIPKIELHCHLDGSLRLDSVKEEILKQGLDIDVDAISESDLKAPMDCESLVDYLKTFRLPLKVLQKVDAIERFTYEVFEDAYNEGCVYLELRYAPVLHLNEGLSLKEVIEASIRGMNRAKVDFDIEGGIILCCMKNFSQEDAIKTIEAGKEFLNKGVVGIDLAGAEDEGFADKFVDAMDLAYSYGYNITIHAGEAASYKNVKDSIEKLHAKRIGHGVRSIEDDELCKELISKKIHLEICPTSNVQTKAVSSLENHPLKTYLSEDYSASINTDNRTVSDTTVENELEIVRNLMGLKLDDYRKMYYNTVGAIFSDDSVKSKLINIFEERFNELEV